MGLLDNTTHSAYYQNGDFGGYQFKSLENIINQFMVAYVGEEKIISKAKRVDIAFHAQRAMQELSFDTFKSVKSQQIELPPSLVMTLPHDYVNYTKLSWSDSAGIKHPLYPTSNTSNPFQIEQDSDGSYSFAEEFELVVNRSFSNPLDPPWQKNSTQFHASQIVADINITDGALKFSHRTQSSHGEVAWGRAIAAWQKIDVSNQTYLDISATGTAIDMTDGAGVLRFGLSTSIPDNNTRNLVGNYSTPTTNSQISTFDLVNVDGNSSYLEWSSSDGTSVSKELLQVNVENYNEVYVVIVSFQEFTAVNETLTVTSFIDDLSVTNSSANIYLQSPVGNKTESSTWNAYKSHNPNSRNTIDSYDYEDDVYELNTGGRYGINPQHTQVNGSFYIDNRLGRIHFSSNVSGKTVILDYISDGLGTDSEMQVHKFAEEALYKWIAHAVLSTRSNTPEYLVNRYKKERFAAIRQAKLRLSNIKLEELTQILRGKSKHIKH